LIDGRKDSKSAFIHFALAAGQDIADAQVNPGEHHCGEYIGNLGFDRALTSSRSERGDNEAWFAF